MKATETLFGFRVRLQVQVVTDTGSGYEWVEVPDGIALADDARIAVVDLNALLKTVAPPCSACGTKIGEERKR